MSPDFFQALKSSIPKLRFRAMGAVSGHILTAEPKDDSPDAKRIFLELLGILGGALAAASILIFKSLVKTSTSQISGVTSARPIGEGATGIALFGYCMQARRKYPDHDEEFGFEEESDIPTDRIAKFLKQSDKSFSMFLEDYFFLERIDFEAFKRRFKQAGIWVITDDIGFVRIRESIFPDFMFFTAGPMEILFWLRNCLLESGEDIQKLRFDKELISVFQINHNLGFISDDLYQSWQNKFGFKVLNQLPGKKV